MTTADGMATRIFSHDWGPTLGSIETWPGTLDLIVGIALKSRFPMLVFWGPELVQIYNDAFVPILGRRHPTALGQLARDCWPEIWDTIGPLLEGAFRTGEPVWGEDWPLVLERNGFPEQTYFTFSYSRIGSGDEVGGVLCTCVETTKSVLREQELRAMADSIADIIYTQTPDGTVEWANSRWYAYTHLPSERTSTPADWAQVLPPEDHDLLLRRQTLAFTNGSAYEAEIRMKPIGADPSAYRWHLVRATPMHAADGRILRWAGSATDIHDRRTAQELLSEQLQRDFDREHQASLAFQNAALPKSLPHVPGLAFDATYEAARQQFLVGGDWYDAFQLADGRVALCVGDVAGNGLEAAVTMAAVRQAIRGAAQVLAEPGAVLDAADRALRSEQPDRIATAFLGILDPLTLEFSYASAGHPPPFLWTQGNGIEELAAVDLPLGLRDKRLANKDAVTVLPRGSFLVMYTDGLTEATRDILEGERRLRAALDTAAVRNSKVPARAILRALVDVAADDIAILTVAVDTTSL